LALDESANAGLARRGNFMLFGVFPVNRTRPRAKWAISGSFGLLFIRDFGK
jgi:hypothetical protein